MYAKFNFRVVHREGWPIKLEFLLGFSKLEIYVYKEYLRLHKFQVRYV